MRRKEGQNIDWAECRSGSSIKPEGKGFQGGKTGKIDGIKKREEGELGNWITKDRSCHDGKGVKYGAAGVSPGVQGLLGEKQSGRGPETPIRDWRVDQLKVPARTPASFNSISYCPESEGFRRRRGKKNKKTSHSNGRRGDDKT